MWCRSVRTMASVTASGSGFENRIFDLALLDDAAFAALEGIEVWIVDCLRDNRIRRTRGSCARWNGSTA